MRVLSAAHLLHVHADEALLEVLEFFIDVVIDVAKRRRVLSGRDHAVTRRQATARRQQQVRVLPHAQGELAAARWRAKAERTLVECAVQALGLCYRLALCALLLLHSRPAAPPATRHAARQAKRGGCVYLFISAFFIVKYFLHVASRHAAPGPGFLGALFPVCCQLSASCVQLGACVLYSGE